MSQNGKGSKPRPLGVAYDTYAENWDRIFKRKPKKTDGCEKFKCLWRRPPSTHDDPCATCGKPWSHHANEEGRW